MNTRVAVLLLIAVMAAAGCGKKGSRVRLVPTTVAELETSPDFKLEHTTKSGIKCYVRYVTPEVADAIDEDNPDSAFLVFSGGEVEKPFLIAVVYKEKVLACDAKEFALESSDGEYNAEGKEVLEFTQGKLTAATAAELSRMMKELGN